VREKGKTIPRHKLFLFFSVLYEYLVGNTVCIFHHIAVFGKTVFVMVVQEIPETPLLPRLLKK
jgi:hypothetical protein